MDLELDSIGKSFKKRAVLKEISFGVGTEELVSIVGPFRGGQDHPFEHHVPEWNRRIQAG